jgi:hypothetical protein
MNPDTKLVLAKGYTKRHGTAPLENTTGLGHLTAQLRDLQNITHSPFRVLQFSYYNSNQQRQKML